MNIIERRIEKLEAATNIKQGHTFILWQCLGEVTAMTCQGVTVHRQEGEEDADFRNRALEEFEAALKSGIHWVIADGIHEPDMSYLKADPAAMLP
ncbi:MAG: hypothetical protein IJU37_12015 [Desulfovibrio sp.]|nr:hypothetical protein [Desulfovibrio sp.]